MMLRVRFRNWRFSMVLVPVIDVYGVNSKLPDGKHFLMWDMDKIDLNTIIEDLQNTQNIYQLPNIYILESNPKGGMHAYCFKRLPFRKVCEILTYTKHTDWRYLRFGMIREEFTLRITEKYGYRPKLIYTLRSDVPEDVRLDEMRNFCLYDAINVHKNINVALEMRLDKEKRAIWISH